MPIKMRLVPPEIAETVALNPESSFSSILNQEYFWAKGDRLFRTAADPEKNASFTNHSISRKVYIWDGYMRSGDILVDECKRNPRGRSDLIYPILYCYRHGLELAMKWVIDLYGRFADVDSADYLDHDLWKLWTACKKVILEVGSDGDDESLHGVQQIVKDFHELDKLSMAFRYSEDKKGITIKLPDQPIDLDNVKNVMQAVHNFFEGVDSQLDMNSSNADLRY
jgi:hypothetical protein